MSCLPRVRVAGTALRHTLFQTSGLSLVLDQSCNVLV